MRVLLALLERRFKDRGLLALLARIVEAHHAEPGRGLPIGALTSQHFANYYLAGLDRLLLEGCRVRGLVRYMDDLVWWGDGKDAVRDALAQARAYAQERLRLTVKTPVQVGRSRAGLMFCGYRILPGRLLLSRRRKRRYAECRRDWENAYAAGRIDARALQAGYATALAITAHADAAVWRREQLRRRPLAPNFLRALILLTGTSGRTSRREPCPARRVLEQQRAQRAGGVPQREPPRQPQRQQRLSLCPSSG